MGNTPSLEVVADDFERPRERAGGHKGVKMDKLLYGIAYYDEYVPCGRLDKDIAMMNEEGFDLLTNEVIKKGETFTILPWNLKIVEA